MLLPFSFTTRSGPAPILEVALREIGPFESSEGEALPLDKNSSDSFLPRLASQRREYPTWKPKGTGARRSGGRRGCHERPAPVGSAPAAGCEHLDVRNVESAKLQQKLAAPRRALISVGCCG
jgi:hypothetical protein